ncbi:MAG: hypothetical protein PHH16_02790 [Candidatus Gracilibacteria bacterium]|nr:hypothetical protein [Candidatus Gracilibacteria bacterium]
MKILSLILIFLSFGSVFAADGTVPEPMSYEGYQSNVDLFCKLEGNVPNKGELWIDWQKESLIKREQVPYADITKNIGDGNYKGYLKDIESDPSRIDALSLGTGPTFLEKASYVYKETMGTIYACAVMNAKIRIINDLVTKIPSTQSNMKQKLKNQLSSLQKSAKQKCRVVQDTSELSVKKTLLDNTTYQYCNYRQYLYYLDNASKNSLASYYKANGIAASGSSLLTNTDSAVQEIALSANRITEEIAHTKEVFPQAMVAFTEFEKTYASHILMELILQDYLDLRDSLKKLLNPIGQVIYKASNAQSPK